MIRILHTKTTQKAPALALGLLVSACAMMMSSSTYADNMYRAAPASITVFTETLPQGVTPGARMSSLSVINIERLNALGADLVQVQLGEDHTPAHALKILNAAYPQARFELFDDFEMEEASMDGDDMDLTFE